MKHGTMIEKRFKNIGKLIILILVRQLVLLGKNIYHLFDSPFLTIKKLWRDKDKSQIFLISILVLSPAIVYTGARVVWDSYKYGGLLRSVGSVFAVAFWVELVLLGYVTYWFLKVIRKK